MNDYLTIILSLAGFCTAITIILVFLEKVNVSMRGWLFKPIRKDINEIKEQLRAMDNMTLKLSIYCQELPLCERVMAAHIYIDERNLNGEVKVKCKLLIEEYENDLKGE